MSIIRSRAAGTSIISPALTDGEKSVLTLSIQGYIMTEIADRMCLSPDTIKKYRQNIFHKLNVRNISEAIVAATNSKLHIRLR